MDASPGSSESETSSESSPSAMLDLDTIAEAVYEIINEKIKMEREKRGYR